MSTSSPHVIVGASLVGATAALTLRAEGATGPITLIGAELDLPYERPPLSKGLLRGESQPEDAYVVSEASYADHEIDLRLGTRVIAVDPTEQRVLVDDGSPIRYDNLLIATGSRPRTLKVPGHELGGVHYLRTLSDMRALQEALADQESRVGVVGAGWIGSEVAASLRQMGHQVWLIDPADTPLAILGAEVGAIYRDLHIDHGVELCLGDGVEAFVGHEGHVTSVRTTSGVEIEVDLVVVGVGAPPRVELARDAGIDVEGGIVVDELMRTSAPGIFAAGDVADAWHPLLGTRVRVEHWANAKNQATTAARNMLGADEPYDRLPYFFSDQYDLGMEYVGHAPEWDQVVIRGDLSAREFLAFWVKQGRVAAAMNANIWDVNATLQDLVAAQAPVDLDALSDIERPLDELVVT